MTQTEALLMGSAVVQEAQDAALAGELGRWYEERLASLVKEIEDAPDELLADRVKQAGDIGAFVTTTVWSMTVKDAELRRKANG